ncbi:MAG: PASTA domain-containing protein [Candidatus Margulisiibacteriota bacterium]
MDTTLYLVGAAIILALIGYLIGIGKILFRPSVLFFMAAIIILPFAINAFIWLYVSSSPETVIPDVLGMPSEKAIEMLAENDLKGEVIGISFSKEPSGTIISQRPEAGRKVKEGRTINLIASAAETTTTVPNIIGKTSGEAVAVLKESGLNSGKVNYVYSESGQGYVTEQSPSVGNTVLVGSEVSMTLMIKKEGSND